MTDKRKTPELFDSPGMVFLLFVLVAAAFTAGCRLASALMDALFGVAP